MLGKKLGERGLLAMLDRGAVPLDDQPMVLFRRKEGEVAQGLNPRLQVPAETKSEVVEDACRRDVVEAPTVESQLQAVPDEVEAQSKDDRFLKGGGESPSTTSRTLS